MPENLPDKEKKETYLQRIETELNRVGSRLEDLAPHVRNRIILLGEHTPTLEDELNAIDLAWKWFAWQEENKPERVFSQLEKRIVVIGTLCTDIGKTEPKNATEEQQKLIAEMYAVEEILNSPISVESFFRQYFESDSDARISAFSAMGLDPQMSMREFYNLHAQWSLEIISGGVPEEAVPGAATHHLMESVNPESLVAPNGRFTKYFGKNAFFGRPEKIIIILDHYDASRRRGKKSHEEAMTDLASRAKANPLFANDQEFFELLGDFDRMMQNN